MITIRRAQQEDIPIIMKFIELYWRKDHIMAYDRLFFEWQYVDDGKVNFYIGIDEQQKKIYGIQGFIMYNHLPSPDISGSILKTIKSEKIFLGQELQQVMLEELNVRYACSVGLSAKAEKIFRLQNYNIIELSHFYRLQDREEYKIATIGSKKIIAAEDYGYTLKRISTVDEMKDIIPEKNILDGLLSKDYNYIEKRYFNHPIYQYDIWKIVQPNGSADSVLITRNETYDGQVCCKIVDFYGKTEQISYLAAPLDKLMDDMNIEYIDSYSTGIPDSIYEKGGFCKCEEDDENIIPNYFHPFARKNIRLSMVDPQIEGLIMFRGDGDQDRPC